MVVKIVITQKNYNNDLSIKIALKCIYIYPIFLEVCKCKVLFSINNCALTEYIYKDFIKEPYNKKITLPILIQQV